MTDFKLGWLTHEELPQQMQLQERCKAFLQNTCSENFVDFMSYEQKSEILRTSGGILGIWHNGILVAQSIVETAYINSKLSSRFTLDSCQAISGLSEKQCAYLRNWIVDPAAQNRGLMTELLNRSMEELELLGLDAAYATIHTNNKGAQISAERSGFINMGSVVRLKDNADLYLYGRGIATVVTNFKQEYQAA